MQQKSVVRIASTRWFSMFGTPEFAFWFSIYYIWVKFAMAANASGASGSRKKSELRMYSATPHHRATIPQNRAFSEENSAISKFPELEDMFT